MADSPATPGFVPSHPGELLAEIVIPATGKTKVEIADRLGVSRQTLYDILGQRQAVTPAVAARLGRLFGNSPRFWLNMQQAHDLWRAERDLAVELDRIVALEPA